ncbi:MAG: copper tolerance protein [Nitrospirales bacterium]|nr:MAG: copper tolerance protein [Nitrospirales bacterium]
MKYPAICMLMSVLFTHGCATVDVTQDQKRIVKESLTRTGNPVAWQQTAEDHAQTKPMIDDLLKHGVTREEAIRISLLNNPRLQATLESLGIARADVVQAGLYTNPELGTLLRFPANGATGTNTELDLFFRISDLWNVPLRRHIAEVDALRMTQLVVKEVLQTAAAARDAFDDVLLQDALHQFMTRNVALFHTTVEELQVRFHAGLVNDLDIYLAENVLFDGQVELARIQAKRVTARTRLLETLGLDPLANAQINIHGNLEQLPLRTLSPEQGWDIAKRHRVDLQLNRLQIKQTQHILALQKSRIFGDVGLGGNYTRELDRVRSAGPVLVLQIPIFNQNQGGIARAEFQLRQAKQQLEATELAAKQEIRQLLAELTFHETHAQLFRDKMLVAQQNALAYVERFYNTMQLNSIFLIEARRRILDTQQGYFQALRAYRQTESTLQVALGGQFPMDANIP